ncbi:MAG: efflux RND transporter permease subunit [Archangium sp.]
MFEQLLAFSLKNRMAVVFAALVVAVFGFWSFRQLTIEAFPDPTDTQVNVITLFDGQPTEEVERQIGLPLERALNGTPNMTRLRNLSMFGLSQVTMTFRDGTDGLWARQQVLERLSQAELPEGVKPELGPYATPIGEVYRYTLKGAQGDPMKLRTLQDWVVRPMLMRVNGVADVVSYGGLQKVIQVEPLPQALASLGLTLQDLEEAVKAGSQNASGGVMERGSEQFVIRSEGLFKSLDDIRNAGVIERDGTPIFVKDVATVTESWAPRQGVVSEGPNFDAVEGIVLMRRGENPSIVLERLKEQIGQINARLADDGAQVSAFYDRSELVDATLETVGHNLLEGAILVLLVLFVFLLDLRAAVIVCTLIPLSLATAFIYLHLRGMSANLLSLGAVDFGVIVDGGVVIIEAIIAALLVKDHNPLPVQQRIRKAANGVVRPTVFALLIIIAAYLPIFMLERVEGRMFSPMANTVAAALVGALLFSVTLVPVLASFAYKGDVHHRESPVLTGAQKLYLPTLRKSLSRPWLVFGLAFALLGITGVMATRLGSEFLPELNEGALYMTFTLPSNISLTEGRKLVPGIVQRVEKSPAVDAVLTQIGRPEDGTDPKLPNNLEIFVKLKPASQWPQDMRTLGDAIADLERAVEAVPGVEVNFSQPIRDNVNESISGQQGQVAVKLYGDDLGALQKQAERVKQVLSSVPGIADLALVKSGSVEQIQVQPDRVALARYGMTIGQFQHVFQTAVGGRPVDEFWEGQRRFDVVLRLPTTERDDVEKLKKLRVAVEGGVTVPLESLARLTTGQGRASINRENGRRYIGIRMNVRDRDLGGFVDDARARVEREAPLQSGQKLEWGGEFENKERAMNRLVQVVPVALLLTLLLLFKAFDSFPRAVLTLLNVPFALTGGIFGLWLFDMPLSVAAAVGFIALIGQASLNGVLVMSGIVERQREGMALREAVLQGARDKLRPVLMTAALAALGLVPAAMSRAMGSETQRPLAVVIVFGTLSACVLTLVLLPVLFHEYQKRRAPKFTATAS